MRKSAEIWESMRNMLKAEKVWESVLNAEKVWESVRKYEKVVNICKSVLIELLIN